MIKEFKHFIHVWEIKGFVNIDKKFKDIIKDFLLMKYGSYQKSSFVISKITGTSISNFLRNKESFIRISNLLRLTNAINIPKDIVEKQIIAYRDHNSQPPYYISFPYKFTPLVLRIIAHIPGDGNIRKDGLSRWVQKDTKPMQDLLKKLGLSTKSSERESICIPRFLIKVSCSALDLKPEELGSSRLINTIIRLPHLYKIQTIFALIEDEASIDFKNYSPINIRLVNKDLIKSYAKLCDSLSYKRSDIVRRLNTGFCKGNIIYRFGILADGIRYLYRDYKTAVKIFSEIEGLWKKDQTFKNRCKIACSVKALKSQEGRVCTKEILKLFYMYKNLSVKRICKLMHTEDYNRIYDRVRSLYKRTLIRRTSYGKYALNKSL